VKNFRHYSQRIYISLSNGDIVVYKRSDDGKNLCLNLCFHCFITLLANLLLIICICSVHAILPFFVKYKLQYNIKCHFRVADETLRVTDGVAFTDKICQLVAEMYIIKLYSAVTLGRAYNSG